QCFPTGGQMAHGATVLNQAHVKLNLRSHGSSAAFLTTQGECHAISLDSKLKPPGIGYLSRYTTGRYQQQKFFASPKLKALTNVDSDALSGISALSPSAPAAKVLDVETLGYGKL